MLKSLQKLLEISELMLMKSEENSWEEATALQSTRNNLAQKIAGSTTPIDTTEAGSCRALGVKIQEINKKILEISEQQKAQVYQEIKKSNASKKMNTAYKST